MGSSLSKSHLPRNYWPEETGQVMSTPSVVLGCAQATEIQAIKVSDATVRRNE
jgi:hypothetical protein